jgi:hypothetical protein
MKTRSMALSLATLICLCAVSLAWAVGPSGSIEDSQGKKTQVLEFLNLLPAFYFSLNDAGQSAPMRDIKSLTWLGGGQIKLVNSKGNSFTVLGTMQISKGNMIVFRAKDPVSGQPAQAEIDPLLVKTITFAWPQ